MPGQAGMYRFAACAGAQSNGTEERFPPKNGGAHKSRTENQKPSLAYAPIRCRYDPLAHVFVEVRPRHYGAKRAVLFNPEDLVDMIKVGAKFSIIRLQQDSVNNVPVRPHQDPEHRLRSWSSTSTYCTLQATRIHIPAPLSRHGHRGSN